MRGWSGCRRRSPRSSGFRLGEVGGALRDRPLLPVSRPGRCVPGIEAGQGCSGFALWQNPELGVFLGGGFGRARGAKVRFRVKPAKGRAADGQCSSYRAKRWHPPGRRLDLPPVRPPLPLLQRLPRQADGGVALASHDRLCRLVDGARYPSEQRRAAAPATLLSRLRQTGRLPSMSAGVVRWPTGRR